MRAIFLFVAIVGVYLAAVSLPREASAGEGKEAGFQNIFDGKTLTTWIKGVKFMDWTETEKRHPDKGGIGLQVHGGGDFTKQYVRYRNIRVKHLDDSK
jgi:hypothetical protein